MKNSQICGRKKHTPEQLIIQWRNQTKVKPKYFLKQIKMQEKKTEHKLRDAAKAVLSEIYNGKWLHYKEEKLKHMI